MTVRHYRLLVWLLTFNTMTAIIGGMFLLAQSGRPSPSLLAHTPFDSFLVPSLLLVFIVGGSALVALIALLRNVPQAAAIAFASGIIMCGWIMSELLLIRQFSWLQVLYFILGVAIVSVSYPFGHHRLVYRYKE